MAIQTLNITKSGTGTGTVTSDIGIPPIDCGDTCSVSQTLDTNVTLTATPDHGSRFIRWTGDVESQSNPVTYLQTLNPTNIDAEFRRRAKHGMVGFLPPYIYIPINNHPSVGKWIVKCSSSGTGQVCCYVHTENGSIVSSVHCAGGVLRMKDSEYIEMAIASAEMAQRKNVIPPVSFQGKLYLYDGIKNDYYRFRLYNVRPTPKSK